MKRRQFFVSAITSSLSALPSLAQAKQYLPPIYHLLLNNNPEPITNSWFDSVGLLPIGDPAFTVTGRSQEIFVDGDAVVQGNGTETSPYKDFYFLGGRNASGNTVRSRIPINPSETVIYVRGTFRLSDHQQDVDGSSMRIQLKHTQMSKTSGGNHLFSADNPLVFAPWPNQIGPIFDAENGKYTRTNSGHGVNDMDYIDDGPIFIEGGDTLAEGFVDVEFRGFTLKNGICSALMRFHKGVRTGRVISCHIHDGQPQSSSPGQSGGIMFAMTNVNTNHLVDHCEVDNNAGNVTNNIGEISWLSDINATVTEDNQLIIQNCIIKNSFRALTGKKSGNSTVIARNNYIHNMESQALYARGSVMKLEYNLLKDTQGICQPDYQNFKAPSNITIDHNTAINCQRIFSSTYEQPSFGVGSIDITLTNNAFLDNDYSGEPLAFFALYNDSITPTPDTFTSHNNRFGFPLLSNIFYKRPSGYSDLGYTDAMALVSDSGSQLVTPDFEISGYTPLTNGNCYRMGSNNTNIGAL